MDLLARTSQKRLILALALISTGCTGTFSTLSDRKPGPIVKPALSTDARKNFRPEALNYVGIMPLENTPGAAALIPDVDLEEATARLLKEFQVGTSLQISNIENPQATADALKSVKGRAEPQLTRALSFGEKLGAQGVIYGVLTQYEKGEGSKLGSDEPAAVGFRLYLVDVSAKEVAWQATFDEVNQPLSENILRLGTVLKAGGFSTAPQLLDKGFGSAAKKLEHDRSGTS